MNVPYNIVLDEAKKVDSVVLECMKNICIYYKKDFNKIYKYFIKI